MTATPAHLTVALPPTVSAAAGPAVLASLPRSFTSATPSVAEVVVVDGQLPSWPEELAAAAGRQVIVVDPCLVRRLTAAVPFVLDTPWGSNPVREAAAGALKAASWQRLECRSVISSDGAPRDELLRLVCLSRAMGTVVTSLHVLFLSERGLAAVGHAGTRAVDFSVTLTDALAPAALVRALTTEGRVHVRIPSPETAAPAELVVTDADGTRIHPTIWETGHRATWRRALLRTQADDSAGFTADLNVVTQAFARKETAQ